MTDLPPCPECGTPDPYVCDAQRRNGAWRLDCRNRACRKSFSSLDGTMWKATKLTPEQRAEFERLWRSGLNPHQIAKTLGRDYKWVWVRVRQLEAAYAFA